MKRGELDGWVTSLIAAGSTFSTINDMEMQFLEAQGYTTGALPDRWFNYLRGKGYTGSLQDMWKAAEAADDLLASVLDIDSIYGASIAGDFFDSQTTLWTDNGKTDPADTAGDVIYHWDGGRSAGTSLTATQSGAAFRVSIASDATYGNVIQNVGGALKEQFASHGSTDMRLSYARVRYATLTASSSASFACITQSGGGSNGIAFYWDNTAGKYKFAYSEGATDIFSGAIEDTDWHTVVGVTVGTSMSLYVDDMTTPVATGTGTVGNSTRSGIQSQNGFQATTYIRRFGFADDDTIATPADLASWLEE